MGRPLLFETSEALKEKIDQYFEWAKKNNKPLTIERFACFLGCDRETILNYEKKDAYFGTIKDAKMKILADKMERLNSSEGNKAGVIFDLKNNHGMKDKLEQEITTPTGRPFEISNAELDARLLELLKQR